MKDYGSEIPDIRAAKELPGYHSISGTEHDMKFLQKWKASPNRTKPWTPELQKMLAQGHVYGRQYVVHRSNQSYPAYLVTYTTPSVSRRRRVIKTSIV